MAHLNAKSEIEALIAVLLWATVATVFKLSLNYLSPTRLLTISSSFSLIVLALFHFLKKRKHPKAQTRPLLFYIFLGFLNPFLYYNLLFGAYSRLLAQEALILNYTWPIALGILSSLLLKKSLGKKDTFALILGFFGVFIVITRGNFRDLHFSSPLGIIFALLSAWVWGLFWSLSLIDNRPSGEKLFLSFLFGTPFIYLTFFIRGDGIDFPLKGVIGGLYVGLFEMSVTFILWLSAISGARKLSFILNLAYLIPFLSMGFIALILKEKIASTSLAGFLVILFAVYLSRK